LKIEAGKHRQHNVVIAVPCPASRDLRVKADGPRVTYETVPIELCQQKQLRDGRLVPILRCPWCGERWRVEDSEDIAPLIGHLFAFDTGDGFWKEVAKRIGSGNARGGATR